ncbi:MAG: translation initiation factor IF-3 [Cytophagales bacterium]|nr:translation initiation factor IF-3 [Cytophagales bacterium]
MRGRRNNKRRGFRRREEEPFRINEKIRVPEVRVVGEKGNLGVLSREDAIETARQSGLDLVEISPTASPPVCRLVDYSKFRFEWKKRQRENKAKTQKVVMKEIRFGPNTDEHDFNFKAKHAIGFLEGGSKVKAYVHFAGRSILFKDRGRELLQRFTEILEDYGSLESEPLLEGKRMSVIFIPKKGLNKSKKGTPIRSVNQKLNEETHAESKD